MYDFTLILTTTAEEGITNIAAIIIVIIITLQNSVPFLPLYQNMADLIFRYSLSQPRGHGFLTAPGVEVGK